MVYRRAVLVSLAFCLYVCSPLSATTRSWTGAVSANWSDSGNWSPSGTPSALETLVFPVGSVRLTMTNDLPALSVGPLTINDAYTFNGNELTLTGDVVMPGSGVPTIVFNAPLKIGAAIHWSGGFYNFYNGAIDVNGQTLTIDPVGTTVATFNGSGTVNINNFGMIISGNGSFSGTINGAVEMLGSMPNANVTLTGATSGVLSGTGTLGPVTVTGSKLKPGAHDPCCSQLPATGVLHTKSLSIGGSSVYDVELAPGSVSDAVQVTGTVTLSASLQVSIISGAPAAGQNFTIIDNDGSDAVSGTFAGMPEGTTISVGAAQMMVTYTGGDGNDVVLKTVNASKTWTGNVSGLWSDSHNWSPQSIPAAGESLVFPAGATRTTMTNDLSALSAGPLSFDGPYTLNGNELTLTADVAMSTANNPTFICNAPLKLGATVHLGYEIQNIYNGAIDVNGHELFINPYNTSVATLNGSGTVFVNDSGMTITGNGSFNGNINGPVEVLGSMSNANLTLTGGFAGVLSGTGTVGTVTLTGSKLKPGAHDPCCSFPATGVLHTKSLSIGGASAYEVELAPGSVSDAVQVTGTVALNAPLHLSVVSGAFALGQSFTIIDNDGADAVSGTFTGMPEGTVFTLGTTQMAVTYHGGDGNDVVLNTVNAQKTWNGSVSGSWSDTRNWSPQSIPATGEALVFPPGAARMTMTNDLSALTVGPLTLDAGYALNGNELTLSGDVMMTGSGSPTFVCNAPVKLGAAVHFGGGYQYNFNGAINVNGQTLTIDPVGITVTTLNGSGTVNVTSFGMVITADGSFSGTINGAVEVLGSMPNANVMLTGSSPGPVSGTGTLGAVTVTGSKLKPGAHDPCCQFPATGVLHTQSLSIGGSSAYDVELAPGALSDAVQVTGTVTLGASLHLSIASGAPAVGQSFTIIDNDGTDAISGTFAGMAEGATLTLAGLPMRVSYRGGDGNDVTVAVLADTSSVLSQNASATKVGEPWILTSTVSSAFGVPTGLVSFSADGVVVGSAPVVNGVASLTLTPGTTGPRTVIATFVGTGIFADNVSAGITHTVSRGQTKTEVVSSLPNARYGQPSRFTVSVSVLAPAAGQPTGSVTILAGGNTLGTVPLTDGTATFQTAALHAGSYSISATYNGDANFEASTAPGVQQNIAKAQTHVDATANSVLIGASPQIRVSVIVPGLPNLVPSGTVSIAGTIPVDALPLPLNGIVTFTLPAMSAGDHNLFINFGGDADFEASSTTFIQSVTLPAISLHGTGVEEGNRGVTTASMVVSLSAPVSVPVRVSFSTVAGSAIEGDDYEKASGVIEFAPGEMTRSIALHILGDTFPEPSETFSVLLSDPVNATIDTASALVIIANDDQTPPRRRSVRH